MKFEVPAVHVDFGNIRSTIDAPCVFLFGRNTLFLFVFLAFSFGATHHETFIHLGCRGLGNTRARVHTFGLGRGNSTVRCQDTSQKNASISVKADLRSNMRIKCVQLDKPRNPPILNICILKTLTQLLKLHLRLTLFVKLYRQGNLKKRRGKRQQCSIITEGHILQLSGLVGWNPCSPHTAILVNTPQLYLPQLLYLVKLPILGRDIPATRQANGDVV